MILSSKNVDLHTNSDFGPYCLHFFSKEIYPRHKVSIHQSPARLCRKTCEYWFGNVRKWKGLRWPQETNGWTVLRCLKNAIDKVIDISDGMLIRGAAHLMLKLFSFDSTVLKSIEEFEQT